MNGPRSPSGIGCAPSCQVLANPPHSIKQWNRAAGRATRAAQPGTPPQGAPTTPSSSNILASMDGERALRHPSRTACFFRKEEAEMRQKLVAADLVECSWAKVEPFYNSPMEAWSVCRSCKPVERQGTHSL